MYGTTRNTPTRSGVPGPAALEAGRFLLLERPAIPWPDADESWTALDRADYERARRAERAVVLLDGTTGQASVRAPAVLRESLLSMWGDSPDDAELRRELARIADAGPGDCAS